MSTVTAYLRNVSTGETGSYQHDPTNCSKYGVVYLWTEGNFSCDCNRSLFLYDLDIDDAMECNTAENVIALDRLVWNETGEDLLLETN